MSNVLTAVRDDIKAELEAAGLFAFTVVPENYSPPAVVIDADEPYVSFEGATFGAFFVNHRLIVVGDTGINLETAEALDAQLLQVLAALSDAHHVEDVGRPGSFSVGAQPHPAVVIRTRTEVHPQEATS